jgi:predicted ArsR family transcriptional regulator
MAQDENGRQGSSAGAMAKELGVSPAKVKRALGDLGIEPDFVKSGCAYYYAERSAAVKKALAKS